MFKALILLLFAFSFSNSDVWEVWLYEPSMEQVTLITQDGVILDQRVLPFPPGYDFNVFSEVIVAPDGSSMAYVAGKSGTNDQILTLYDYTSNTITGTYQPPDLSYSGLPAFNQDATRLAFGNSTNAGTWEIAVIDLSSLQISALLSSQDSAASGIPASPFLTPYIQSFNGDNVAFAQVLSASEGIPLYDNYVWNISANTVRSSIGYGQIGADIYPVTGETLMALHDIRFQDNPDPFPFFYANTLNVYDPTTRARYPFYTDPVNSLGSAYFVQNGENILASVYDGAETAWILLSRDGQKLAEIPPGQIESVQGTPNGFLYTRLNGTTPELRRYDPTSVLLDGTVIYTGTPETFMKILWVGLRGSSAFSLGDYPAWARLADAEVEDGGALMEAADVVTEAVLREGGQATVNTTGGDSLNVRSAAGTEFQIRAKLPRGTIVSVLEGPAEADGFSWWRIRTADGVEGWTVDFADGEVTLVPGTTTRASGDSVDESVEGGADPTIPTQLAIGDSAIVRLTQPNVPLRLRNAPGTDTRIIMLMPDGLVVRVVDGPRLIDGYTWWQIRTPEGNVGWTVEIVASERVLVKTG